MSTFSLLILCPWVSVLFYRLLFLHMMWKFEAGRRFHLQWSVQLVIQRGTFLFIISFWNINFQWLPETVVSKLSFCLLYALSCCHIRYSASLISARKSDDYSFKSGMSNSFELIEEQIFDLTWAGLSVKKLSFPLEKTSYFGVAWMTMAEVFTCKNEAYENTVKSPRFMPSFIFI